MINPTVRIIILNYNGASLLPQCLPSIVEAARHASYKTVVTVLNNKSEHSGLDYVRAKFPEVVIAEAPENLVLCSYNDYLSKIDDPIVILLNNDIRTEKDFIDPLVKKFIQDPNCFLAAPRVMSFDGSRVEAGRAKTGFKAGMFWCDARFAGYEKEVMTPSETESSGFGAFSRKKFLDLGGYDPRYLPGIMEDVDLCLSAKRAGFSLYYEPSSVVYHMGQATFKSTFGSRRTAVIAHRNNFRFMWKNFTGLRFWLVHLAFLPLRMVYAALRGQWAFLQGFWEAVVVREKWRPAASENIKTEALQNAN